MEAFIEKKLVNWSDDCKLLTDGGSELKKGKYSTKSL